MPVLVDCNVSGYRRTTGLIIFEQAIANGKMSITSDTLTTQEYFAEERGALCNKIQNYLGNECSEEKYTKTLRSAK